MANSLDNIPAIPNKLLQRDGSVTDFAGQTSTNPVMEYANRPALPNKFLNPDGSYSTFDELLGKMVDTNIFIVVDTLPKIGESNKIYLVPNNTGSFWARNSRYPCRPPRRCRGRSAAPRCPCDRPQTHEECR